MSIYIEDSLFYSAYQKIPSRHLERVLSWYQPFPFGVKFYSDVGVRKTFASVGITYTAPEAMLKWCSSLVHVFYNQPNMSKGFKVSSNEDVVLIIVMCLFYSEGSRSGLAHATNALNEVKLIQLKRFLEGV